jgi:hypothetical protein
MLKGETQENKKGETQENKKMKETSKCQTVHSSDNRIHRILDSTELVNATSLALDMLAQGTQSTEPCTACVQRAYIKLVLVAGAPEMLVKPPERLISGVTQVALIGVSVPGTLCRIIPGGVLGARSGDHTRWVGDDVVSIIVADFLVNVGTINPRNAVAGFEVEDHGRNADECHGTTPPTTLDGTRLMSGRIEMLGDEHSYQYRDVCKS